MEKAIYLLIKEEILDYYNETIEEVKEVYKTSNLQDEYYSKLGHKKDLYRIYEEWETAIISYLKEVHYYEGSPFYKTGDLRVDLVLGVIEDYLDAYC